VLQMDVTRLQEPVRSWTCLQYMARAAPAWIYLDKLVWMCPYYRGLSCTWTYLDCRNLCCTYTVDMSTQKWTELHLDVSRLQEPVLHLEVSTPQFHELHLDVYGQHEPALLLDVSTLQGPELHLDISIEYRNLCCTWTCLRHRSMSCT
jgi:hypothetical protein